jgi:hypothetical protein
MTSTDKKVVLAPSSETEARQREVQLLINIAQPDPKYQPFIVTDEASLLVLFDLDEHSISFWSGIARSFSIQPRSKRICRD